MMHKLRESTGGAFGAGLVLIVMPSVAIVLLLWQGILEAHSIVGLPLLAIFGIMILFGALALVSTVFARLGLSSPTEALALPPGSIRAAIALSLIVLFAIISVMLYQAISQPYSVTDLDGPAKEALVSEKENRVMGVIRTCKGGAAVESCAAADVRYTVHLRQSPGAESTDLAKQLLVIIGTLMTSVTSYYFASRSNDASTKALLEALTGKKPSGTSTGDSGGGGHGGNRGDTGERTEAETDDESQGQTPKPTTPSAEKKT